MKYQFLFLVPCLLMLAAGNADASLQLVGLLNPDPDNANPASELAAIKSQYPGNDDLIYFQRWDTDTESFEVNPGIGSYTFDPPGNVVGMDITWDLTATAFQLSYVLVKGANDWNLYSVTPDQVKDSLGPQEITVNGRNGVSHVSFFGVPSTGHTPEPSSMIIWGLLAIVSYAGTMRASRLV